MNDDDGSVRSGLVTVADLYREFSGIRQDITAVLTRLEVTDVATKQQASQLADHEARLRILERFRYTLAGLSIVGGVIAGAVGYWVGHVVGH